MAAITTPEPAEQDVILLEEEPLHAFESPYNAARALHCSYPLVANACRAYRLRAEGRQSDRQPIQKQSIIYTRPRPGELVCTWQYFGKRVGNYQVWKPSLTGFKMNLPQSPINEKRTGRPVKGKDYKRPAPLEP